MVRQVRLCRHFENERMASGESSLMWGRGGSERTARHRAYTWGMANNDQGYDPFEPGHSTPEFEQFARENQKYRKASHARGGAGGQKRASSAGARSRSAAAGGVGSHAAGSRATGSRDVNSRAPLAPAAARLALRLLQVGEARRLPAARASTLRAAQTRRYRRRAPPAAAKRQVERLPPCRRRLRARRGPHLRSLPCRRPNLSPCSPVRTTRRTTS